MSIFNNNRYDEQQPVTTTEIMNFLVEMSIAQDKRFDRLSEQGEQLKKEVANLRAQLAAANAEPLVVEIKRGSGAPAPAAPAYKAPEPPPSRPREQMPPQQPAQPVCPPQPQAAPRPAQPQYAPPQPAQPQPAAAPAQAPRNTQVTRLYFGEPDGAGFESNNYLNDANDGRVLYVVECTSPNEASFYPMSRSFHRLRANASTFLLPLCNVAGDVESANSFEVSPADYGKLRLEDGYWMMVKKCTVNCV